MIGGYGAAYLQISDLQSRLESNSLEISKLQGQISSMQPLLSEMSQRLASINQTSTIGNQTPPRYEITNITKLYENVKNSVVVITAQIETDFQQGVIYGTPV